MMLVHTWYDDATVTHPPAHPRSGARPGGTRAARLAAARRFYCDLLGGRQVWRTGMAESRRTLWFIIDQQVIAVPVDARAERRTTMLEVDDPAALAEQCWDAGYGVFVGDEDAGDQLVILDPFENRIQLVAAEWSAR